MYSADYTGMTLTEFLGTISLVPHSFLKLILHCLHFFIKFMFLTYRVRNTIEVQK